jgi:glycosyltransferase involved in cell wall biosynthesis
MLLVESEWLRSVIEGLRLPPGTKVLNFGSQRHSILRYQAYIEENIYRPVARKHWELLNFDLFPGEGVDISGNILNDDCFFDLLHRKFRAVFALNVLEHLTDRVSICSRIEQLVPNGGYLLVSVPFKYPIHNDPIDNLFRPTPDEVMQLFPSCTLVKSDILIDKSFLYYVQRNIYLAVKFILRILTPFYKFSNWKTQVALFPYFFKQFQVTVAVLKKRGSTSLKKYRQNSTRPKKSNLNIVYIGIGIFPHRIAGDKNFLIDLSAELNTLGANTYFISIAKQAAHYVDSTTNNYLFLPRIFHWIPKKTHWFNEQGSLVAYNHKHSRMKDLLEVSATLLYYRKEIHTFLAPLGHNTVVHWLDYSALVPFVRKVVGSDYRLVVSALSYIPLSAIQTWIRARSLSKADAVITGTSIAKEKLLQDGCTSRFIEPFSWGSQQEENRTKRKQKGKRITKLLWSGYIQHIGLKDFIETVKLAKRVLRQRSDLEFTFLFKPESFQEQFMEYAQPGIRIGVTKTSFIQELNLYDVLFSPLVRNDLSLAPPLTWIEALSRGLPVITTRTMGVEEYIQNKKSGIIFTNWAEMEQWFLEADIHEELGKMHESPKWKYSKKFDIAAVSYQYLQLYKRLVYGNGILGAKRLQG